MKEVLEFCCPVTDLSASVIVSRVVFYSVLSYQLYVTDKLPEDVGFLG